MAKKQGKSGLGGGGFDDRMAKALERNKGKPAEYSMFGDLPPGIKNGVAKFVRCDFGVVEDGPGKKNVGEEYVYMAGQVVFPKAMEDGTPVAGGFTNQTIMLCDTGEGQSARSADQNIDRFLNELKKLEIDTDDCGSKEELQQLIADVLDGEPVYFKFSTRAGGKTEIKEQGDKFVVFQNGKAKGTFRTEEAAKETYPYAGKDPMVFHYWNGVADWTPPEEDDVEDDGEPVRAARGERESDPTKGEGEPGEPFDEFGDLDSLAEKADATKPSKARKEAQDALEKMALDAGISADDVEGADSWADVVEMIKAGGPEDDDDSGDGGGDDQEPDEDEQGSDPEVGFIYGYKPAGSKKVIDCEVTAVMAKSRKVNLKESGGTRTFKGVPWDELRGDD